MGLSLSNSQLSSGNTIMVRRRTYRVLNLIGRGGEATVYRCKDQNGHQYALKVFIFSRYAPRQMEQRIENFMKEAKILKYLSGKSQHFIYLYDYEYKRDENIGYLLMELGHGSLRNKLQGNSLSDEMRKSYWKQIVAILKALDDAQIVHADIKPDNIIFVGNILKITDLGLAFRSQSNGDVRRSLVRGTLDYMAPEVFFHRTGFKSDIWSAGIILYEMAYGRPPYYNISDRQAKISAIKSRAPIPYPPLPDHHLIKCIQSCLQFDSQRRPSATRLQLHPFSRY